MNFLGFFGERIKVLILRKVFSASWKKIILHCGNPKTRGPSHPHKVNLHFRVKIGIGWYPIYSIYCALPFTMMGPTIAIMLWCLSRWYFVVSFYFEQELTSNRTVIRHTATHWEIRIQNFPLLYQFTCNININIHQNFWV